MMSNLTLMTEKKNHEMTQVTTQHLKVSNPTFTQVSFSLGRILQLYPGSGSHSVCP